MIESHKPPPMVEFDPADEDHLTAAALLFIHGRQHPRLRFLIDPSRQTTVREQILKALLYHYIPKPAQEKAATMIAAAASRVTEKLVLYENTGAVKVIGDNLTDKRLKSRRPVHKVSYGKPE